MTNAVAKAGVSARISRRLGELDAAGLRRTLTPPSGIDLSSNDYLGLSHHPLLKQAMAGAALQEGVGSTGSRLLRGERTGFSVLETRFAAFKGTDRSLYFSSGYMANLAVLTALTEAGDTVFSDEWNHASLIDGARLSRAQRVIFRHNDVDGLRGLLQRAPEEGEKFIVVESLFSMDGDEAPLQEYADLCHETGAHLIVDEAHAVGVFGKRGSGLIEETGVSGDVFVSINSAGKALGVSGAFVAGASQTIEYLVQRARPFIFSTAPPPPVAAAINAALDTVSSEPQRRVQLLKKSASLRSALGLTGRSQIVPVVIGENEQAVSIARTLQAAGFDVRAVRPPAVPAGTARLRISLNTDLSEETLEQFISVLLPALPK